MRKTAKKLAASALAITMVLSMSACSSKKSETTTVTTVAETTVEETTLADTAAEETTIGDDTTPEVQGSYKDGVYEGIGTGNNGDIKVEVVVEDGKIISVELKEHEETEGLYEDAEKTVIAEIIEKQTTEVDAVTGATNTSNGIIEAVADALSTAV